VENGELQAWFQRSREVLEGAYLAQREPWRQSGMSGSRDRWERLRKPVADCVHHSGSFLDIGCANGYLLECCLAWIAERGLEIEPFGLDLSAALIDLAKQRLPRYAGNFYVGNAFFWRPEFKFDFVRTELVYVPADLEAAYLENLLERFVKSGGRLLAANYGEGLEFAEKRKHILPGSHPTVDIMERLAQLGYPADGYRDGFDPVKNRRVRVAYLEA